MTLGDLIEQLLSLPIRDHGLQVRVLADHGQSAMKVTAVTQELTDQDLESERIIDPIHPDDIDLDTHTNKYILIEAS